MKNLTFILGLMASCALLNSSSSHAQEWTRFRGPNGTGISAATGIPVSWSPGDYNWKVALPGSGHSSPVLWGSRIFLTSNRPEEGGMYLLSLDAADGRVLWRKEFKAPAHHLHPYNSFASSSPAVDAERVYVNWTTPRSYSLLAFTHEGEKVWERDLGPFESQHGGGISPMLHDGKVICGNEQMGESSITALDAKTGEVVWKTKRNPTKTAYSTPCVYRMEDGREVLVFNSQSHGIYGVDPDDGQVVWEYTDAFDKRSVSSPVAVSGLLIGSCGSGGGGNYVVAVRPPKQAGGKPELAFEVRRSAPYVPSPVAVGDLLFLWSDGGVLSCVKASTGEVQYQERVGGDFFGSPVVVEDRIYCISTAGEVVVARASDKFEVLARNPLGELSRATPAVAGGRLYLRTEKHLISLGQGEPEWVELFNGKNLEGWVQRNGQAKYRVENGEIVGQSVPNTGNSFLCTEQDYDDFILELEFKVDSRMNAGVQFRSQSLPDYKNGRVHGYQYEIDPSDRAWTGGIYDEARRGWLKNLKENPAAQKAFRQNEWNKLRVKAVGDSIETWINDVPAAQLKDSMTLKGFVGLQVHGVGNRQEPMEIRWRKIRMRKIRTDA